MADRSEILAAFQSVTGKDNLDECERILENHGWDLEKAVLTALAMQEGDSHLPPASSSSSSSSSPSPSSATSSSPPPPSSNSALQGVQNRQANAFVSPANRSGLWGLVGWLLSSFWDFGISLFSSLLGLGTRQERRREVADPVAVAARFLLNFEQKYGTTHPPFFQGSYNQALRETRQSFRMLVVYLHCDDHQDSDAFCRETMASPDFIRFIQENNMVLWCGNINEQEGHDVSSALFVATYPYLAIIGSASNRSAIVFRQDGLAPVTDLVARMTQVVQLGTASLRSAREEQELRDRERQLRREQEREYEESLRADQEKERRLQEEREAKERALAEERRLEEERKRAEEEARILREKKAAMLPAEPAVNDAGITTIVFRMPDGSKIQRRFWETDAIQIMYDFIDSKDLGGKPFTICNSYPKTVFSDKAQTLKEASLCPKALVIVEEA